MSCRSGNHSKALFYPFIILLAVIFIPHIGILVLSGTKPFFWAIWVSVRWWLPQLIVIFIALKIYYAVRGLQADLG